MEAFLPLLLTRDNFKSSFLNCFDTVLLDLDGTLWEEDGISKIPHVAEAYQFLVATGKRVFFVTNSAQFSRRKLRAKLASFGIQTEVDKIYTSAYVSAQYIRQRIGKRTKVYAMVDQGFKEEFEELGVTYIGYGKDSMNFVPKTMSKEEIQKVCLDRDVGAVVVGLDPWFSITKLFKAASYLQNPKCLFLTTDMGDSVEVAPGFMMPGPGALVGAVRTAARREAPKVIGKPTVHMFDLISQEHLGVNADRTILIGDKIWTDIAFARENRIASILVMTGHTRKPELDELIRTVLPKRVPIPDQKKGPSRFKCCDKSKGMNEKSEAAKCACAPTFLLPSFGDIGVWAAPPPSHEETCQCYVPSVLSHDVC